MSTNQKLRKFGGISLIVTALLLAFMPSCGKKGTMKGTEMFVERIQPLNEAMLALLDSYTSGIIAAGEPVMVRFNNPATLKVKYGETIPAKAFDFKPALKGKAVWIDENTIGFQYDDIDKDQNYVCQFKMADFVDVPADQQLEFGFGVRRQNFSLVTMQPVCTSNEEMSYLMQVAFATPIDLEDAVKIFDDAFRKAHPVEVASLGNNLFEFELQGFKRQKDEFMHRMSSSR